MNLLGAKLYDPGTAVSKATSSLIAMTAFDTTNLRVAVTIPAHGMIYVRVMGGAVTGATTVPTILLGVLNGATVLARMSPQDFPGTMNATTQSCPLYAEFVITGLTPGAMNLDLAYGVEVIVASTNIKYGGPNNTTTNDAWGGISFQVWDPQPMEATFATDYTAARAAKLDDLDAAVSTRMATYAQPTGFLAATFPTSVASPTNITAGTITTATNLTNAPPDSSGVTTLLTRAPALLPVASDFTAARAAKLDDLDATVSSRLASASYTAPDNTDIAAIKLKTDNLPSDPADESLIIAATDAVMSRLGSPAGATVSADIAAVQAKTTNLPASPAATSDIPSAATNATAVLTAATASPIASEIKKVNGVTVNGDGSATPWGP